MGQSQTVDGFRFLQIESLSTAVKDIEIKISTDNTTWENVVVYALEKTAMDQNINLSESKTFRYFKIITKKSHDVLYKAKMAEISA